MSNCNDSECPSDFAADDSSKAKRPTVLCVDDDPNISEAIARRLHRSGIQVLRAYHGMQGCWLAATEKPDVIVLDVVMPQGSGIEILECLKRNEQTSSIPVIVLTGKTDPDLCGRMERLGAVRYLSKPIPFEELLDEITRHVSVPA
jgi:DNA-binding response OmpR family regulator